MYEETFTEITVVIPDRIGQGAVNECFMKIADLAYELMPDDPDWDVLVFGRSGVKEDDL